MNDPRLVTEDELSRIRARVEAQRSRYGARWNQILKDRAWLLAEVDRLKSNVCTQPGCKLPRLTPHHFHATGPKR